MLKTLRITSLVALALAVCGVLFIAFLGLRKDADITAYLDKPGIIKLFEDKATEGGKEELKSPLVDEAHQFALRINPPPPPKPVEPVKPKDPKLPVETQRTAPPKDPTPPAPKGPINAKFTLLATVLCEVDPSRSMVLLQQTGGKDEWFWQGERVGNLDIDEVRDGSAVFSQNGRNPQVLFVPAKPKTKSLLKNEPVVSGSSVAGATSVNILVDPETRQPVATAAPGTAVSSGTPATPESDRSIPTERNRGTSTTSEEVREEVNSRIRRIRTVPKLPPVAEQRENLNDNISNIQELMNREDSGVTEEQRQEEKEAWTKLLTLLESEKENLPTAEKEGTVEQDKTSQTDDAENSETEEQPRDPNEK